MVTCESCGRHARESESSCPFCGGSAPFVRLRNLAGAAVASWVLTACYGSAVTPYPTTPPCVDTACEDSAATASETGDTGP